MKKTAYLCIVIGFGMLMAGCSSSEWEDYQLFPDPYEYDVKYNSIYHYGYNQGCESALYAKGVANTQSRTDSVLAGSQTRFDEGWREGNQACKNGLRVVMPTSLINGSSPYPNSIATELTEGESSSSQYLPQ
ncbi:hypothetical protein [Photobacterium aquae]|uniref:hypothetical protein n=1 Tax=Photobacterium aquae TaxID=1195763 RepID=UPI000AE520AF|nr:hypothetical protein [Photobacterium aquae]